MDNAAIAQIVTLATLIAGFAWQYINQGRQRRWDLEDRAALAIKVVETSRDLAAKVESSAASVQRATEQHVADLKLSIADNTIKTEQATVAAHEAYKEANNVNGKISDLQAQLLRETQTRKDQA